MKQIEIHRVVELDESTIGVLLLDGYPFCATLEQDWQDNKLNVSCVPDGTYPATVWFSSKYDCDTIRLTGTEPRTNILIHPGNFPGDTKGCILVGKSFVPGAEAISTSRVILKKLIQAVKGHDIQIKISDYT